MRPCHECGQAVANHRTFCEPCTQIRLDKLNRKDLATPHKPTHRVTTFNLSMFLLEMVITAFIVGIPLGVICTLVALFFFPNWWAVPVGFGFGFAAGILFWLIRTYFFAQSIRKPLQ